MTLGPSCPHLPSAMIAGVHHHAQLTHGWQWNPRPPAARQDIDIEHAVAALLLICGVFSLPVDSFKMGLYPACSGTHSGVTQSWCGRLAALAELIIRIESLSFILLVRRTQKGPPAHTVTTGTRGHVLVDRSPTSLSGRQIWFCQTGASFFSSSVCVPWAATSFEGAIASCVSYPCICCDHRT